MPERRCVSPAPAGGCARSTRYRRASTRARGFSCVQSPPCARARRPGRPGGRCGWTRGTAGGPPVRPQRMGRARAGCARGTSCPGAGPSGRGAGAGIPGSSTGQHPRRHGWFVGDASGYPPRVHPSGQRTRRLREGAAAGLLELVARLSPTPVPGRVDSELGRRSSDAGDTGGSPATRGYRPRLPRR